MPRPILGISQQKQKSNSDILSMTSNRKQNKKPNQLDKMSMYRLLRKRRSKEYMDAIHKLDAGGHVCNQNKVDEIIETIRGEFPETEIAKILLGYVGICYLGKPYEVHLLDISGSIVQHYKEGQTLPNGLEKARGIAMRGGYCFIEVYADCYRAIDSNGYVSVIAY